MIRNTFPILLRFQNILKMFSCFVDLRGVYNNKLSRSPIRLEGRFLATQPENKVCGLRPLVFIYCRQSILVNI